VKIVGLLGRAPQRADVALVELGGDGRLAYLRGWNGFWSDAGWLARRGEVQLVAAVGRPDDPREVDVRLLEGACRAANVPVVLFDRLADVKRALEVPVSGDLEDLAAEAGRLCGRKDVILPLGVGAAAAVALAALRKVKE
jgi:hypothetical protein